MKRPRLSAAVTAVVVWILAALASLPRLGWTQDAAPAGAKQTAVLVIYRRQPGESPENERVHRRSDEEAEAAFRSVVVPNYDDVTVLTGEKARAELFAATVSKLNALGAPVDLFLFVHGSESVLAFNESDLTVRGVKSKRAKGTAAEPYLEDWRRDSGRLRNIRMVYLHACHGGGMAAYFMGLGARAVVAVNEESLNSGGLPFYLPFFRFWSNHLPLWDVVDRQNKATIEQVRSHANNRTDEQMDHIIRSSTKYIVGEESVSLGRRP